MNFNQITLPALDVAASVVFYKRLGFRQIVDAPHYARFESLEGEATFSVHQVAKLAAETGVVMYFEVQALDERVRQLKEAGIVFTQEPRDENWLWREARLKDPAGNELCLYWAGENRKYPPWRISGTP